MSEQRSTVFTSPRSASDFALRLVFFALAPFGIVAAAAFFPVQGALLSVLTALSVFLLGETARAWASERPKVGSLLARELAFEAYYRARPPRPFLYYVFYPLLFPYWLLDRDARAEFWLFKGFTLFNTVLLLVMAGGQYAYYWPPELGPIDYAPVLGVTLLVEWLLVLALLMPIATTIVGFHSTMRRGRLWVLLLVGLLSTTLAAARLVRRRDPIVSFATRERVQLRTSADPGRARRAQRAALAAAWARWSDGPRSVEGDGKVEGEPLDAARQALQQFYKADEAFAFDLWASPRRRPEVLVLYFPARRKHEPLWLAIRRDGVEVTEEKSLPPGAFAAMRHAALH